MSANARLCPACNATLAGDAVFCHKCGSAAPPALSDSTPDAADDTRNRERLQRALGDSVELRRLLGRGGFGEVYVAYDRRLKREIAVKTIRGDVVASESTLARFQHEAEAVARLRHPNIIPVFGVGEGEGLAYITMPLIKGETLADAIESGGGRFSVGEACRILREAAAALDAAHNVGIVHRDIKPENLMLEGDDRTVVVMDFGIAKSSGAKGITGTGVVIGTPDFMSPEQAGGAGALNHQSDQYSLAVVGYRMLSGRMPFESGSLREHVMKLMTETPPPLSSVVSDVPDDVSRAIARALATEPGDRFGSINEFAAALVPAVATGPNAPVAVRRVYDLGTRVGWMREALDNVSAFRVMVVLLLYAVFGMLDTVNTPPVVLSMAASKPDAVFAAREFLKSRGLGSRRESSVYLESVGGPIAFLHRQIGADSLNARAQADLPVIAWHVGMSSPDSFPWAVFVGPGNRITGFSHAIADSVAGARLTTDSARALASAEIAVRGWKSNEITFVRDSVVDRAARTDHRFTWRVPSRAVVGLPADTAMIELQVIVSGETVTDYREIVRAPTGFSVAPGADLISLRTLIGVTSALFLWLAAVWGVSKRNARDALPWRATLQVVATFALVGGVSAWGGVLSLKWVAFAATVIVVLTTPVVALAETLGQQFDSKALRGYLVLARGSFAIPEAIPAAIGGYAAAAMVLAVGTTLEVAVAQFDTSTVAGWTHGMFAGLRAFAQARGFAFAALAFVAFAVVAFTGALTAFRTPRRALALIPALYIGAWGYLFLGTTPRLIAFLTLVAVAVVAVRRIGLLGAFVGAWVYVWLGSVPSLLRADLGEFRMLGVASIAVALVPAAIAYVAARRYRYTTGVNVAEDPRRSEPTVVV